MYTVLLCFTYSLVEFSNIGIVSRKYIFCFLQLCPGRDWVIHTIYLYISVVRRSSGASVQYYLWGVSDFDNNKQSFLIDFDFWSGYQYAYYFFEQSKEFKSDKNKNN